jgi:hypothetical protein
MASRGALSVFGRHGLPTVDVAEIDHFLTSTETAGAVPVLLLAGAVDRRRFLRGELAEPRP